MTEEQIDALSFRMILISVHALKWILIQIFPLLIIPYLWGFLSWGNIICIVFYTLFYNVYWDATEKDKHLDRLWKPYILYVIASFVCLLILHRDLTSLLICIFLPLYGVLCFIIFKKYKKYRKLLLTSTLKRMIFAFSIILVLFIAKMVSVGLACRNHGDLMIEKLEILKRRNFLVDKLITKPANVIEEMPYGIGEQFRGEWALYSCSMFSYSLVNITKLYPDTKDTNLKYIDNLINIVLSPELKNYDTNRWGEDALASLDYDRSHISYLSHLAWMIGGYKSIGGDDKYDVLYNSICETINRRIIQSPAMNLPTYPNEPIYIPDMLVAVVALNQYAQINDGKFSSTVYKWVDMARNQWCDSKTGLLVSFLNEDGTQIEWAPLKGSYTALNCSYLTLIDEDFAKDQYEKLKKNFWKEGLIDGFKEYRDKSPIFTMDIDAGPVIFGLSPSGTAFGIGAVTYFNDNEVRNSILLTAEKAGTTISWNGRSHYALANIAIVGEAIMLAMRTNVNPHHRTEL